MTRAAIACLWAALAGACEADPVEDQVPPPIDAAAEIVCDTGLMENVIAERELQVGDYCDVIELCAADADQAEDVEAIEPGFDCGETRGCESDEIACAWNTPDFVEADELDRLCSITALDDPPRLRCWVFL